MTIEFIIEGLPATTNSGGRAHWAVKAKEAKKWKYAVHKEARLQVANLCHEYSLPLKKARLTLTRYSTREPDYDGLVSGFKHILDGLKEAGVIVDDKVSVIGQPIYLWEEAKPRQGKIKVKVEGL